MSLQNLDKRIAAFLPMLVVCALTALGCFLLYRCDNKYTAPGPQARDGVFWLEESRLTGFPVFFLTEGWEYYSGRLLTPEDFAEAAPTPDAYIYIGQFGGFEAGGLSVSPHGSASYRLRIRLPEESRTYLLELPEIFSAYRLYVNGREAAGMGDPTPERYRAETGSRTVSIAAGSEVELLFAVSDFSHLYSGMVYPPAFGEPEAVSRLLGTRFALRCLFAAFALAIGLLSALTGLLGGRNRLAVLYGLLCLCFVGFTGYPILRTLTAGSPAWYAAENISFCAMLVVGMLLQKMLHGQTERWSRYFIGFGAVMCVFSALLPLLLSTGSFAVMAAYSYTVAAYELLTAAFLTIVAIHSLLRDQPYSAILLCGFLILDVALVMDRLLPLHEPIVTGWFYELASFALILCIGGAVGLEISGKYRENAVLTERQFGMERLAAMQTANYELLMEQVEETKAVRHDLRHHFIAIDGFLKARQYDRLSDYMVEYGGSIGQEGPVGYTRNIVADVLLRHYGRIAVQRGISFTARAELGSEIGVADSDLCAILSNLLENAVEACERTERESRFISVVIAQKKSVLSIFMENSADIGATRQGGPRPLSTKAEGRLGYGLASVTVTAGRYGGEAEFAFDEAESTFISTVVLFGQ